MDTRIPKFHWAFWILLAANSLSGQDVIRGTYAYTHGDNESLVEARETCKSLAVRDAIESYYLYVESSTQVENNQVKDDIVRSIAAGMVKNLRVTDQREEGRTVTMTVEADVDPAAVQALVAEKAGILKPAAESSSTGSADSSSGDFTVLLSKYENRLAQAENEFNGQRYDPASTRLHGLGSLLQQIQSRARGPFETRMAKLVSLRNSILVDFIRIEKNQAANRKLRERAAVRELRRNVQSLEAEITADRKSVV